MEISYLGHSCFLIKGKKTKVLMDPFGESVGLKQMKAEAEIVTISHDHDDHNDMSRVSGQPMVIQGPGEYEIKGVSVIGVASFHDDKEGKLRGKNTIYILDIGGVRVCHLGDLGHKLSEKQLNILDGADVLLIPVGGEYTIDSQTAKEVVKQIGPSIVIPMHFKVKGMKKDFDKLEPAEKFLDLMGNETRKEQKLVVKKTDLPEETEVVLLERRS